MLHVSLGAAGHCRSSKLKLGHFLRYWHRAQEEQRRQIVDAILDKGARSRCGNPRPDLPPPVPLGTDASRQGSGQQCDTGEQSGILTKISFAGFAVYTIAAVDPKGMRQLEDQLINAARTGQILEKVRVCEFPQVT
jgi:DNA-binding TFAR19-related protein (PDSD5 family)